MNVFRTPLAPYDFLREKQRLTGEQGIKPTLIVQLQEGRFFEIELEYDCLTPLFEKYKQWFNEAEGQLTPQFDEINDEIGNWLDNETKIRPQPKGFVRWFIDNKIGEALKAVLVPNIVTQKEPYTLVLIPRFEELLIPTVTQRHLQEYCNYRLQTLVSQQSLSQQQLSTTTSIEEEDSKVHIVPSEPQHVNASIDKERKRQLVRSILAPLAGINLQKEEIMESGDFIRLIEYTDYLVLNDKLPENIIKIKKVNISIEHIRFTFYRLHKEVFATRKIHDSFVTFLHAAFGILDNTSIATTKAKFSTRPSSYERDFNLVTG